MEEENSKEEIKEEEGEKNEVLLQDNEKTEKEGRRDRNVVSIVTAIVLVLGFIVSVFAYCTYREANRINEIAQRPYVSLEFNKVGDSDFFVDFDVNSYKIELKVENKGNVPAKNVFVMATSTKYINGKEHEISTRLPQKSYALAPNESMPIILESVFNFGCVSQFDCDKFLSYLNEVKNGEGYMNFEIKITYNSELHPNKDYHTYINASTTLTEVIYLSSSLD